MCSFSGEAWLAMLFLFLLRKEKTLIFDVANLALNTKIRLFQRHICQSKYLLRWLKCYCIANLVSGMGSVS